MLGVAPKPRKASRSGGFVVSDQQESRDVSTNNRQPGFSTQQGEATLSPVIRKWGMRGVAALCIGAFAFAGLIASVGVFAAANGELPMSPLAQTELPGNEGWWLALDRYGLPTAILAIISYYVRKGVIAVWEYAKPLGHEVVSEYRSTVRKQGEFAENANTLLIKSVEFDKSNGIKIDEMHEMTTDIYGAVVKRNYLSEGTPKQ